MIYRFILLAILASCGFAYSQGFTVEKTFRVGSVHQAVAVDGHWFYTISNREINKYTLDGEWVAGWKEADLDKVKHLNSGVVVDGKLYCAHSNFPEVPMASSVEVFDTKTMQHAESISLGINIGSCTWIIPKEKGWFVFFAHYDNNGREHEKDVSLSQLIEYDNHWVRKRGWTLPGALVEKVRPNSLSGAVMINGTFYCTGHDAEEAYLLKLPDRGMNLLWTGTVSVPFKGQGIAADKENNLWGIDRKEKLVIKAVR